VSPVPATALWKPTRLAVVRTRCSHTQPEPQLTAVVVPFPVAGGPWSAELKLKPDMTDGVPNG